MLRHAPTLDGWRDARDGEAVREAFAERAAIMEEGAKVDRRTAERWARACVERVPGAVGELSTEDVRRLVAGGALGRAP